MSGGFQVQEDAIQTAIGHLTDLLNDAQTNDNAIQNLRFAKLPGEAKETQAFHAKLMRTSGPDLVSAHQAFIQSVQGQIQKLQTTLKRYQAGEDATTYGFGN